MATHARGTFRMAFGQVGPTELRILLAVGTLQLMRSAFVTPFGHSCLLFDVGGAVGIAGLLLAFADRRCQERRGSLQRGTVEGLALKHEDHEDFVTS